MSGVELVLGHLEQLHALRALRLADPRRARALAALGRWQAERLARTHGDLLAEPRYRPAVRFFLDDLYGAIDLGERHRQLRRVVPLLARVLPADAVATLAAALEMNVLTEAVDANLVTALAGGADPAALDEAGYATACRRAGDRPQRARQIALIREVGEALDTVVAAPGVHAGLRLARGPARLAGLAALHEMLERGLVAFRHMAGARDFLDAICGREARILERIFAGHPRPFARDDA